MTPDACKKAEKIRGLVREIRLEIQTQVGGQHVDILEHIYDDLFGAADRLERIEDYLIRNAKNKEAAYGKAGVPMYEPGERTSCPFCGRELIRLHTLMICPALCKPAGEGA